MGRTANLRRQHDGAMALVGELTARIDRLDPAGTDRVTAAAIVLLLAKLEGLLRIHFAQEDRVLYPSLMRSPDATVADTARRFFDEMGAIGPAFDAYVAEWRAADAVMARPQAFAEASRALFAALGDRIARENGELYPMADAEAMIRAA